MEREIGEESGLVVHAATLLDAQVFEVVPGEHVLIVTFGCTRSDDEVAARPSDEHEAVRFVAAAELDRLRLPEGYRRSIRSWSRLHRPE